MRSQSVQANDVAARRAISAPSAISFQSDAGCGELTREGRRAKRWGPWVARSEVRVSRGATREGSTSVHTRPCASLGPGPRHPPRAARGAPTRLCRGRSDRSPRIFVISPRTAVGLPYLRESWSVSLERRWRRAVTSGATGLERGPPWHPGVGHRLLRFRRPPVLYSVPPAGCVLVRDSRLRNCS